MPIAWKEYKRGKPSAGDVYILHAFGNYTGVLSMCVYFYVYVVCVYVFVYIKLYIQDLCVLWYATMNMFTEKN